MTLPEYSLAMQREKGVHAGFRREYALTILLLLVSSTCLAAPSDADWTLERDVNDIQLYTRVVAGSPINAVKVKTRINATQESVMKAMWGGEGCDTWRTKCKSSKILKTISTNENYTYFVLNLPWPLADRDIVMHSISQIDITSGKLTVRLKSESSYYPDQGYVRAESSGKVTLSTISDKVVELVQIMHTDLRGKLPTKEVNARTLTSTLKDITLLRALAED